MKLLFTTETTEPTENGVTNVDCNSSDECRCIRSYNRNGMAGATA